MVLKYQTETPLTSLLRLLNKTRRRNAAMLRAASKAAPSIGARAFRSARLTPSVPFPRRFSGKHSGSGRDGNGGRHSWRWDSYAVGSAVAALGGCGVALSDASKDSDRRVFGGRLVGWGCGLSGALGNGNTRNESTPTDIMQVRPSSLSSSSPDF